MGTHVFGGEGAVEHGGKLEDNLRMLIFSSQHAHSREGTWVVRLECKHPYPLSCLFPEELLSRGGVYSVINLICCIERDVMWNRPSRHCEVTVFDWHLLILFHMVTSLGSLVEFTCLWTPLFFMSCKCLKCPILVFFCSYFRFNNCFIFITDS